MPDTASARSRAPRRHRTRWHGATVRVRASPLLAGTVAAVLAGCDSPTEPILPPLDDLPADLATLELVAEGRPTAPYVILEVRDDEGFGGFVAVNADGRPVWFFRTESSPFSFTRRANGNFVLLDSDRGLVEVSPDGEVVRTLAQEDRPGRRIHHDILATERNTVLFLAEEWRAHGDTVLNGEAIWEWTPESGEVMKRWSAFDHLDPDTDHGGRSTADDWLHANSLSRGPRGNIVVSLHFLNQVISITPDFQGIEWRVGGTNATTPIDDPFTGQHTAVEIATDRLLVFDNGFERSDERYSRAAEYQIEADGARLVWEWRPERDNWARVISSARRLPNGNTLVAFGVPKDLPPGSTGPIEVYEVTRDGNVVWHLAVDDRVDSMYRATPIFDF